MFPSRLLDRCFLLLDSFEARKAHVYGTRVFWCKSTSKECKKYVFAPAQPELTRLCSVGQNKLSALLKPSENLAHQSVESFCHLPAKFFFPLFVYA